MSRIDPKKLGLALLDWHGGGGSGLYAVGSSLYAGYTPDAGQVVRALRELKRMKEDAKYPEAMEDWDVMWCNHLAVELERYAKSVGIDLDAHS